MTSSLLSLLHLCDSLFPTGGFAHSDGLESATDGGRVAGPEDLGDWMDAALDQSVARCDAPAVSLAWQAFVDGDRPALNTLNTEVYALRTSASSRQATRAMGARLVRTWLLLYPQPDLQDLLDAGDVDRVMTLPPAFGVVCASAGIAKREAIEGFVYTRLAATASAAMRLMRIGQHDAHRALACRLHRAHGLVDAILTSHSRPAAFAPAMDVAAMSHRYVHSRLFRS
jgi:urease accessory protein